MAVVDRAELSRLCATTNFVLREAREDPDLHLAGAINWGNLRCIRALEWSDDSGDHGLAVEIEEAAPDATELHSYVSDALKTRGWANVGVTTEW
jgi:hypothetical protein